MEDSKTEKVTPSTEEVVSATENAPVQTEEVRVEKGRAEPNEAFFGSLLLFCLALSLLSATGYFGFAGYRYFKQVQKEKAIPSIDALPKAEVTAVVPEAPSAAAETAKSEPQASAEAVTVDKKKLVVKVLNGGAAKGVAGSYGEKLKATGFTQTTVGNSIGDYTGQVLYYAKDETVGANVIKAEVTKTYPKLVVKEAPVGDKDAAAATYVLILGR